MSCFDEFSVDCTAIGPLDFVAGPGDSTCFTHVGENCTADFAKPEWDMLKNVKHILWGASLLDPTPFLKDPGLFHLHSTDDVCHSCVLMLDAVAREQIYLAVAPPLNAEGRMVVCDVDQELELEWILERMVTTPTVAELTRRHGDFRVLQYKYDVLRLDLLKVTGQDRKFLDFTLELADNDPLLA